MKRKFGPSIKLIARNSSALEFKFWKSGNLEIWKVLAYLEITTQQFKI